MEIFSAQKQMTLFKISIINKMLKKQKTELLLKSLMKTPLNPTYLQQLEEIFINYKVRIFITFTLY
jgi:hypothetical protein